jgi:hypothetical protein
LYTANDEKPATRRTILRVPLAGGTPEKVLAADIYGRPDCALQPHALCAYSERSQDRTQIVFISFDPSNGSGHQIASFAADTKADYRWAISPGADSVALVNTQTPTIDVVYLNGRPARKITVEGQRNFDWLFWTPDGKGFYVSTQGENGSFLLHVDLQGNAHTVWEEEGGHGTFGIPSPDGKHIALQGWTIASNLWTMENF